MAEVLQTEIVEAEKLDDSTVQQLITLINAAYHRHSWIMPHDRVRNKAEFHEETAGKEIVLFTDSAGKLVGTAMIYAEEDYLYLGLTAVDHSRQGQGYGAQMLQAIEGVARQRKLARIKLISAEEIGNVDYYLRHGFQITEQEKQPAGTWGALGSFTTAIMEKRLQTE